MNRYISALLLLATGLTAQAQNDSTFTGTAQKGFYVRAGLGYAAPQSTVVTSTSLYDFKDKRGDYATGLNEAIGAGYMFNSHIGVELNANLYAGKNK